MAFILAFDTSATVCSVAIQKGDRIYSAHEIAPMQQAKRILPMIKNVLAESSLTLNELDAIAYGAGPGSFTGIRIANSVAQGLAYAAEKPVIQVSSLAILAESAFLEHGCRKMLVAIDARMEQIYWAMYEVGQKGHVELIGEEQLCAPHLISLPINEAEYGVGDGWGKYDGFKPKHIYASQLPKAEALLPLAALKYQAGQWVSSADAVPFYLR